MIVAILGMHRSGTSAITHMLNVSGLYLGKPERLMEPHPIDNPDGYWEHWEFVRLNNHLLAKRGGNWKTPPMPLSGWFDSGEYATEIHRAQGLIQQFRNNPSAGWKDPRTILNLEFWQHAIPDLRFVLCIRNPIEVAQSLRNRQDTNSGNGLGFEAALVLWEKYHQSLLSQLHSHQYLVTHYESYLYNAYEELRRIHAYLGHESSEEQLQRAAEVLNTNHRRNFSVDALLYEADVYEVDVPDSIQQHYAAFCGGAGEVYEQMKHDINYHRHSLEASLIQQIRRHKQLTHERNATISDQHAVIEQQTVVIKERDVTISDQHAVIEQQTVVIKERDATISDQHAVIEQQAVVIKERDATISDQHAVIEQQAVVIKERDVTISDQHAVIEQQAVVIKERDTTISDQHAMIEQQAVVIKERDVTIINQKTELQQQTTIRAKRDATIAEYKRHTTQIERENAELKAHIQGVKGSISWRLTAPLRFIKRVLPGPTRQIRRGAKLIWWTATLQLPSRLGTLIRHRRQAHLITESGFFDVAWYQTQYPDTTHSDLSPIWHYLRYGAAEGRNPGPNFDTRWYLSEYPDVAESGMNPLVHYIRYGKEEGREAYRPLVNRVVYERLSDKQDTEKEASSVVINSSSNKKSDYVQINDYKVDIYQPTSKIENLSNLDQGNIERPDKPIILFHTHNLKWQGAQNSLFEIAKGVKEYGKFYPILCTTSVGPLLDDYTKHNISAYIHQINRKDPDAFWRSVFELADIYQKAKVSLIHTNTLQTFHVVLAANAAKIPVLWNIRESEHVDDFFNYLNPAIKEIALKCIDSADELVFVSDKTKAQWSDWGLLTEKSRTIKNGIDLGRFLTRTYNQKRSIVRARLGLSEKDVLLLNVGTVSERKGQLDIVDALTKLKQSLCKNIVIMMIGFSKNSYSENVYTKLLSLHQEGTIRFIGYEETNTSDNHHLVAEAFLASNIFILSSRHESYPRVVLEAMSHRLPVIATPCFGVVEQVEDNETGLFYQEGNSEELAQKIELLASNHELRQRMGDKAFSRLTQISSYTSMLDSYHDVYFNLLNSKRG